MSRAGTLLRSVAVSLLLVGGTAFVIGAIVPDQAYAKGGNGNGNGNGGGNGNGNGGGNGNGHGADKSKSDDRNGSKSASSRSGKSTSGSQKSKKSKGVIEKFFGKKRKVVVVRTAPASTQRTTKAIKAKRVTKATTPEMTVSKRPAVRPAALKSKRLTFAETLGVHPSELGALNAANASPQALANAAPNSRVGRIASYRDAVLEGRALEVELEELQAALDEMDMPERSAEEVAEEISAVDAGIAEIQAELDDLEQELADAGGEDPAIEDAIAAAEADLATQTDTRTELEAEFADAVTYEDAVNAVEDLETDVANQAATQTELLEAAANKPVTPEVEQTVQAMLGIAAEEELAVTGE